MSKSIFDKEYLAVHRNLFWHKKINQLVKLFTFGLFNNEKRVSEFQLLIFEKKKQLDKYNELLKREENIENNIENANLNSIRIGKNTHSDINVIGREEYGNDWNIIRDMILSRDNYQCPDSDGYCSGVLQVHHLTSLTKGGTNQEHNLITLCFYHHSLRHEHMKRNL
jgi:hypothetical protein